MVTHLYIDNYKGFVDFHIDFGRIVFLMGRNGSGKSSLLEVLHAVATVIGDGNIGSAFERDTRFRFGSLRLQKFGLHVQKHGRAYQYRLEIDRDLDGVPIVHHEELSCDGVRLFVFEDGEVRLFDGKGDDGPTFPVDRHKGGLAVTSGLPSSDSFRDALIDFKLWASDFLVLRLNLSAVSPSAPGRPSHLAHDGSNFVSWYETVSGSDAVTQEEYLAVMKEALPGLRAITLEPFGNRSKLWSAAFEVDGRRRTFELDEMSDGQISLVILYALLYFGLRRGATIALDEPDNYLSLAEIEPFIYQLEDAAYEHGAQVFLISHHPEIHNHWARDPGRCLYLEQTDEGHFTARAIDWDEYPGLSPAEVVARGWQDA